MEWEFVLQEIDARYMGWPELLMPFHGNYLIIYRDTSQYRQCLIFSEQGNILKKGIKFPMVIHASAVGRHSVLLGGTEMAHNNYGGLIDIYDIYMQKIWTSKALGIPYTAEFIVHPNNNIPPFYLIFASQFQFPFENHLYSITEDGEILWSKVFEQTQYNLDRKNTCVLQQGKPIIIYTITNNMFDIIKLSFSGNFIKTTIHHDILYIDNILMSMYDKSIVYNDTFVIIPYIGKSERIYLNKVNTHSGSIEQFVLSKSIGIKLDKICKLLSGGFAILTGNGLYILDENFTIKYRYKINANFSFLAMTPSGDFIIAHYYIRNHTGMGVTLIKKITLNDFTPMSE
jgi:hypothetical protein